jgi:hypothetical protein
MKTTGKKLILIIALVALVSCVIAPVSAEILSGDLGSHDIASINTVEAAGSMAVSSTFIRIGVKDIQNSEGLYFVSATRSAAYTFDASAPNGATSSVSIRTTSISGPEIGTGSMGYNRIFNLAGSEVGGVVWLLMDNYNMTGLTGDTVLYLNYTRGNLYNVTAAACKANFYTVTMPVGGSSFIADATTYVTDPYITNNYNVDFWNSYIVTKPSGPGISGTIHKHSGSNGILSSGRAFVFNGTSDAVITNDPTQNTVDLNFSTTAGSIKIGVVSGLGVWYNSSILFATAVPTVTPTPTTTIPAGYVRNNLYIWDSGDSQITGADINILDVEAGTWTNYTADADGWVTIDTLPYHTVNVYAHYPTPNIYLPNEILGLETGYYGGHNWVLVLFPYTTTPAGYVTLYINARNYDTKAVLTGVGIQIEDLTTHASYSYDTGTTDSIWSIVTNATNYKITGSKSGYISKSTVINSGEDPSMTVVIELSRATVTTAPTSTIPPGGVTTAVTVAPGKNADGTYQAGYTNMQGQEMMNWLAENGMALVQLCFLVTVFALLGIKFGK